MSQPHDPGSPEHPESSDATDDAIGVTEWRALMASGAIAHTHAFPAYRRGDAMTNRYMVDVVRWAKIWGEAGIRHVYTFDPSYRDRHSPGVVSGAIQDPWLAETPDGAALQMPIRDVRDPYPQPGDLAVFYDRPEPGPGNHTLRRIAGLSHGEQIVRPWILFGPPLPFADWPERLRAAILPDLREAFD